MASPFDTLDELLSSAVATAYGEAAILTPRVATQYAQRAADENRPATNVWGVFSAGPGESPIRGQASAGEFSGSTRLQVMGAQFWMTAAQVSALGFAPARGDRIAFPDRAGSPVYAVAAIQHTDLGDTALMLVREDQPE
ncbi:MAG: hypothetical protein ACKOED_04880 [Aestuariivirga sp.]|uniref:hypothetical protein n=1 Tax=Aestuariivirga sp. TaxID=2650926 RepID=UPI0038D08667